MTCLHVLGRDPRFREQFKAKLKKLSKIYIFAILPSSTDHLFRFLIGGTVIAQDFKSSAVYVTYRKIGGRLAFLSRFSSAPRAAHCQRFFYRHHEKQSATNRDAKASLWQLKLIPNFKL